MRSSPEQLERQMEYSPIERAASDAAAAAKNPTVPLSVLIDALAAVNAALSVQMSEQIPFATYSLLARSSGQLGYCIDKLIAAQQVGVQA